MYSNNMNDVGNGEVSVQAQQETKKSETPRGSTISTETSNLIVTLKSSNDAGDALRNLATQNIHTSDNREPTLKENPKSSIKRVIGKGLTPEDKDSKLEEMGQKFVKGGEPLPEDLEKTSEQVQVIELANKVTDEFLISLGLPPFPVPADNIHIVEELKDDRDGLRGTFHSDEQLVRAIDDPNLLIFANKIIHEMLHFKSHGARQKIAGQDADIYGTYRGGFHSVSRDASREYFSIFDEALTELAAKKITETIKKNKPAFMAKEIEETESASQSLTPEQRDKYTVVVPLPENDPRRQSGATRTAYGGYLQERAALNMLFQKIYTKNSGKYSSISDVENVFFKGKFQGNLLQAGRLVDDTFGNGAFRTLGISSQNTDDFRHYVEKL